MCNKKLFYHLFFFLLWNGPIFTKPMVKKNQKIIKANHKNSVKQNPKSKTTTKKKSSEGTNNQDEDEEDRIDENYINNIISIILISITTIFKKFMFCTDLSRKTVVVKLVNDTKKLQIDDFIYECIKFGENELQKYINNIKTILNKKVTDEIINTKTNNKIQLFLNDININIKTNNKTLHKITKLILTDCKKLFKVKK